MSQFSEIITKLEGFAEAEWERLKAEGIKIEQALVPVLEDAFAKAVDDFGQLAVSLVTKFMQEEFAVLSGEEKQGQVVTGLVQEAEVQAKALAIADAQALAKNSFLAVSGAVAKQ